MHRVYTVPHNTAIRGPVNHPGSKQTGIDNSLVTQPGWWWVWAGRASLEGRPGPMFCGCWSMHRRWLGAHQSLHGRAHSQYLLHRAAPIAARAARQSPTQERGQEECVRCTVARLSRTIWSPHLGKMAATSSREPVCWQRFKNLN